jgi:hypothetical protein
VKPLNKSYRGWGYGPAYNSEDKNDWQNQTELDCICDTTTEDSLFFPLLVGSKIEPDISYLLFF